MENNREIRVCLDIGSQINLTATELLDLESPNLSGSQLRYLFLLST